MTFRQTIHAAAIVAAVATLATTLLAAEFGHELISAGVPAAAIVFVIARTMVSTVRIARA